MAKEIKTIGIVGGGQLGRMLTDAAHKLGFKVIVLDPTVGSPAAQVADEQIVGGYKDKEKTLQLASKVDVVTYELEGVNEEALEEIEENGKPVYPSASILKTIKDKFAQKAFLQKNGIPVGEFALIDSVDDAKKQAEIFGYPFLIKARCDAFDGRGNFVVKKEGDISEAFSKLNRSPLYAEKFVPFVKELAVVSARDQGGNVVSYPVVETIHKNNICHIVHSPAEVSGEVKQEAEKVAAQVLEKLNGVGVFAVEMFLKENGEILVNEIAPRVHNSGHHTIEAFNASQFEQHIRAITGMPLITPNPQSPHATMVNILGERDGKSEFLHSGKSPLDTGVFVHIYGKMETRKERKMGHITALGNTLEEAKDKALNTRKSISI